MVNYKSILTSREAEGFADGSKLEMEPNLASRASVASQSAALAPANTTTILLLSVC